mmetsp:Transcript_1266/g.2739  ORF Transcript_1266/g.2739 Transcript_1266/m.2739 type:complete len:281 (-) Transcript_1266:725-1567(-)
MDVRVDQLSMHLCVRHWAAGPEERQQHAPCRCDHSNDGDLHEPVVLACLGVSKDSLPQGSKVSAANHDKGSSLDASKHPNQDKHGNLPHTDVDACGLSVSEGLHTDDGEVVCPTKSHLIRHSTLRRHKIPCRCCSTESCHDTTPHCLLAPKSREFLKRPNHPPHGGTEGCPPRRCHPRGEEHEPVLVALEDEALPAKLLLPDLPKVADVARHEPPYVNKVARSRQATPDDERETKNLDGEHLGVVCVLGVQSSVGRHFDLGEASARGRWRDKDNQHSSEN